MATRLSDLDVSGLGISTLAGPTLVQYSGSLTGRDFRAIAQTALFVLYDMVTPDCLETWKALSKLVPLLWQPEIPDLKSHLVDNLSRYFLLSNTTYRTSSTRKSVTSYCVQHDGPFAGSTNLSSTSFYTWWSTYDDSGLPFCSPQRHLNPSMPSYDPKVCTPIGRLPRVTSRTHSRKGTALGIW